ncbi:MAG: hypothetical protein LC708_00230, partial [Actinobacteria bacterium]|nr:hypothetical protein [Actinomycetota bacterium]
MAGRLGEDPFIDRGQGVGEDARQLAGLDPVADVGVAEAVEKVEEVPVPGLVEQPEQMSPDAATVLRPRGGDGVVAERLLQPLHREALAGDVEVEVDVRSAIGDEEPAVGPPGGGGRLQPGAESLERHGAVGAEEPKFEPEVPDVVTARPTVGHEPGDGGAVAAGGVELAGIAVEQEGEQHLEGLRL